MLSVDRRQHLLLADELVVVLIGLGIEARIVIGIKGLRARRARINSFVQTAQASRAGCPVPGVVTMSRFGVTITQQAGAASVHGRKLRAEQEQPQAVGVLEVGIGRQRLDFSTADEIVASVVAELSVC